MIQIGHVDFGFGSCFVESLFISRAILSQREDDVGLLEMQKGLEDN